MPTSLDVRHLTNQQLQRKEDALAFVACERDLYRRLGTNAGSRLHDDDRRRLARLGHDVGWNRLKKLATIAKVGTIRKWYRQLIGKISRRSGGRARTSEETEKLVLKLARDNSWGNDAWGAKRIVGELKKLGISIAKSTVSEILQRHGIPPAPERGLVTDGDRAIVSEVKGTAAIDFAKVSIIDHGTIIMAWILIAIHISSRELEIVGVWHDPDGQILVQSARNLTMADAGFFDRRRVGKVIMDRDPLFTTAFRQQLRDSGINPHRIRPDSPWENGYAERLIRSLKEGLLQKAVFTSLEALRFACREFQDHFNRERPHQGIGNELVIPSEQPIGKGAVVRQPRIGGLINHYERAA